MQLTLHDANLKILGWIDNVTYDTLSYSDDLLTKDLPTGASTYRLKIPKRKIKSDLGTDYLYKALNERAWISFTYRGKVQLFSIRDIIEDRTSIELYCEDLNAELLNEYANPYSSSKEQTFAQYCEAMELLKYSFLKIGRNEISKEKLSLEFTSRETKLARIIALARAFNAEFEFTVRLNPNSNIKDFTLDVYHGHDDKYHGVGTKRNDLVLNYSNGLRNIRRKVSKKNIFNMIVPIGKRSNSTKNKKTVTNNPDGTKTITEKITNENGYVTTVTKVDKAGKVLSKKTVTTVKNNNGTVSKSTSQNTSGSVSTSSTSTVVVTNPDKSTTRTTTTRKSDGTVEKTIVHTKIDKYPDKSTKTTTTTTKPDGSVTERVSWRYANGTSNTTTRVIKSGKSTKSSVVTKVDESDDGEFDLAGMPDWSRKNSDGVLEFYKRGAALYAPISAHLYPSTFTSETGKLDQWTRKDMEFEADSEEELNGKALAELEKYCYPEIIYELDGYIDGDIGDTVIINDTGFDDMLTITARITKQQISFTNPKSNKTEIANVRAVNRMLSSGMQNRLNQIIEETKPYTIQVTTDNGVMFKNGVGTSLVTPILVKGVREYPEATWRFTLNGETTVGLHYLINANQIESTQVLTIAAYIGNDEVATHQLTFVNVADGKQGKVGTSSYTYWAYSAYADGRDMTEFPGADTVYAGQCVTDSKTRPSDYRLYTWSKIKGDKGDTGTFEGEIGGVNLLPNAEFSKTTPTTTTFTVGDRVYKNVRVDKWQELYNSGLSNPGNIYHALINETFYSDGPVVEFNESNGLRNWKAINVTIPSKDLMVGTYYFSADLYATGAGTKFWFGFYYYKSDGTRNFHSGQTTVNVEEISVWKRLGGVIKLNNDVDFSREIRLYVYSYNFTSNSVLYLKKPKLENGNIGTAFSLNPSDIDEKIDNKADQALTQRQLLELKEKNDELENEIKARLSQQALLDWAEEYDKTVTAATEEARAKAEEALVKSAERLTEITELGEKAQKWETTTGYIQADDNGLTIAKDGSDTKFIVINDVISFVSGGKPVMTLTKGELKVDNGVFALSVRVGRFVESPLESNPDINVIRYVGEVK